MLIPAMQSTLCCPCRFEERFSPIIVGGGFGHMGSVPQTNKIAVWRMGEGWTAIAGGGNAMEFTPTTCDDFARTASLLYVACTSPGGTGGEGYPAVVVRGTGDWIEVGTFATADERPGWVNAVAVSDELGIVAGGGFAKAHLTQTGQISDVASVCWIDGQNWAALGNGIIGDPGEVHVLMADGHLMWVGFGGEVNGQPSQYDPTTGVAAYNTLTHQWMDGKGGVNGRVNAIHKHLGDVIVGGNFWGTTKHNVDSAPNAPVDCQHICRWDSSLGEFRPLTGWEDGAGTYHSVFPPLNGSVNAMASHGDKLIIAGHFQEVGGWYDAFGYRDGVPAKNIAYFDGHQWGEFGSGLEAFRGSNDTIYAMDNYEGGLVIGGSFNVPSHWSFSSPNIIRASIPDTFGPAGANFHAIDGNDGTFSERVRALLTWLGPLSQS